MPGLLWYCGATSCTTATTCKFRFRRNEALWCLYKASRNSSPPFSISTRKTHVMGLLTAIVVGSLGAGGAVVLAPVALAAVGFTAAGISAGSVAAGMMSTAAVANGGGVAAGSLVALLQSASMAGLSGAAAAGVAGTGGALGGVLGAVLI